MSKVIYRIMILLLFSILSAFIVAPYFFDRATSKPNRTSPFRVVSIVSRRVKHQLGDIGDIVIKFSGPLALRNPHPELSVPIKGSWVEKTSTTLEFKPYKDNWSAATEEVLIPSDMKAQDGAELQKRVKKDLVIANSKVLKLQEVLANLGYLPVRFTKSANIDQRQSISLNGSYLGRFHWRWKKIMPSLEKKWQVGVYNSMTKGAVMSFERTHSMIVNSALSSTLLNKVEKAKAIGSDDPDKYSYVFVSEKEPETLKVYENNAIVYSSLTNTGMDSSTPIGTWPIYLRNLSQTLRGTYPNGTPYVIPDVRYINYFNGNFAVHGFKRTSYGWPQSAGCVELPETAASKVWSYLHYGTLVTVANS